MSQTPILRRRAFRSRWLVSLAALLMTASGLLVIPEATAGAANGTFGALPYGLPIQSRCEGMSTGGHVYFVGQTVTASTSAGICGAVHTDINWSWGVAAGAPDMQGCAADDSHCSFKVTSSTDNSYVSLCIDGSNVQGAWTSCDYYAVVDDGVGILDGYIHDKDGGPVAGVAVKAYGHPGDTATTDATGFYAMTLDKGNYQVSPERSSTSKATFTPAASAVTVVKKAKVEADFTSDVGIEVKLHFDKASVVANGLEAINGTVTTDEGGKPLPNTMVQLEPQPGATREDAVTKGPLAAVCSNGSLVWPANNTTLSIPSGAPVDVTTGSNGVYDFTITVGTTPGQWSLDAWAFNSAGQLSNDTSATSETKSVTFEPNGKSQLAGFIGELATAARATSFSTSLNNDANSAFNMVTLLSTTAKSGTGGVDFGGLAFAMVNAKEGQSMLVFPADKPPVINTAGDIVDIGSDLADLVYDPAEWTGAGLAASVAGVPLTTVMSKGLVTALPTLAQFDSGKEVSGWQTVKGNGLTIFGNSFQYDGWAYPSTTPGVCY
jgi:hypothetical protein